MSSHGGRYPFLEPVHEDLRRAKWIWTACCFSPIVYFVLARAIHSWWFRDSPNPGFLRLEPNQSPVGAQFFLGYIVALQAALVALRRWFNRHAQLSATSLRELMAIYMKRTLILLGLSECAVLGGFLYFLALGDLKAVLIGGIFSYLFYAQSYPSEEGLARLASRLRDQSR